MSGFHHPSGLIDHPVAGVLSFLLSTSMKELTLFFIYLYVLFRDKYSA